MAPFTQPVQAEYAQQDSGRFSGDVEVTPTTMKPAEAIWRFFFHEKAEAEFGDDWKGAGFVRCRESDVGDVIARLDQVFANANQMMLQNDGTDVFETAELRAIPASNGRWTIPGIPWPAP